MSIALKSFLKRLFWTALWGGASSLVYYLTNNLSALHLPVLFIPAATTLLAAVSKYITERQREEIR